jgi:hypothetical protein
MDLTLRDFLLSAGVSAVALLSLLWRPVVRLFTEVKVAEGGWAGTPERHAVVKSSDGGRWAVWPVWDHDRGGVASFRKRRWGWRSPVVTATLEDFNQYRSGLGERQLRAAEILASDLTARQVELERSRQLSEEAFDELVAARLDERIREYRLRARQFWKRAGIACISGAVVCFGLIKLLGGPLAASKGVTITWSQSAWAALEVTAAIVVMALAFVDIPKAPRKAWAALELIVEGRRNGPSTAPGN